tara:strand:- start:3487 stop:3999 length:513 start_codon:yes stop_codon:yes gene_type:complete
MRPFLQVVNIEGNKDSQTIALISTASFTIIGGALIYFGIYFLGVAVMLGGGYGFYAINKTRFQANSLVQLDVKGVNVNMPDMKVSLLWNEVKYCSIGSSAGFNQLLIFANDPEELLDKLDMSNTKRKLYSENIKNIGTFIFFPTSILDIEANELLQLMEDYRVTANNKDY